MCRLVQGKVKVGAVNCDEEKSLCSQFGVQGFPTVKWFGANKQSPEDYQGERTAAALSDFALKQWGKTAPPPEVRTPKKGTQSHWRHVPCCGKGPGHVRVHSIWHPVQMQLSTSRYWCFHVRTCNCRSMSLSAQRSSENTAQATLMNQQSSCASLHFCQISLILKHLVAMPMSRQCARWLKNTRTGLTATCGLWADLIPSWSEIWMLVALATQLWQRFRQSAMCMPSCSVPLHLNLCTWHANSSDSPNHALYVCDMQICTVVRLHGLHSSLQQICRPAPHIRSAELQLQPWQKETSHSIPIFRFQAVLSFSLCRVGMSHTREHLTQASCKSSLMASDQVR